MPQIIKIGGGLFSKGELFRINPSNNSIESSSNGAVHGFHGAQTLLTEPSAICFLSVVRYLQPQVEEYMSLQIPLEISFHAVPTPLTATS